MQSLWHVSTKKSVRMCRLQLAIERCDWNHGHLSRRCKLGEEVDIVFVFICLKLILGLITGYKHSLHEGGIRTASFITGPRVTRGRVIDDSGSFFHVSDWYPTILSATSAAKEAATAKKQLSLDGISAWTALTSASLPLPRTGMIIQYDLVLPNEPLLPNGKLDADSVAACHMSAAARLGDFKLIVLSNGSGSLFYNVFEDRELEPFQ